MTSSAVEENRKLAAWDKTIGLAYFYYAFNNGASQEPFNVLGSLPATLSQGKPELLLGLEPQFRTSKQSSSTDGPELEDIEDQLRLYSQELSKVYFLVDTLNGSKHYQAVINSLARLFEKSGTKVYIMLTSTDEDIDQDLERFPSVVRVRMARRTVLRDIEAFVEASLVNITSSRRLKSSTKAEIRTILIAGSNGM